MAQPRKRRYFAVTRKAGATWVLPSEDEWYKAAYYDPRTAAQGGPPLNAHYWQYPTKSNTQPYSVPPPGTSAPTLSNTANGYFDDQIANGYDNGFAVTGSTNFDSDQTYATDVGAYSSSVSFFGTFDQAGNLQEWNEGQDIATSSRGIRGGSFFACRLRRRNKTCTSIRHSATTPFLAFESLNFPSPVPSY